jgi:septal ring factor EnvC (AmiA/AmiB activator)
VSALTKVFIVLQVILAILLVAGQIVFVNRTEDFRTSYKSEQDQYQQEKRKNDNLTQTDQAVIANLNNELQTKNNDVASLQKSLADTQTQLDTAKTSLAAAQADNDKMTASNGFSSQALKVALDQNGTLQSQYSDLQKTLATMQKDNADNTMAIADLRSRLDATERQREFLSEQNAQLSDNLDTANKFIKDHGLTLGQTSPVTVNPEPSVPLVGSIQDTRVIDNVPYATISIGSADQVTSGMQFKVIDPAGTFLGYLKVDTVEPHAASGRLDGPHVSDVHAGNEVRTQL